MTTITPTALAELRAKAEAATPAALNRPGLHGSAIPWLVREFHDAANPTTILAILAALDKARGEVDAFKNLQKWREEDEAELATLRAEVERLRGKLRAINPEILTMQVMLTEEMESVPTNGRYVEAQTIQALSQALGSRKIGPKIRYETADGDPIDHMTIGGRKILRFEIGVVDIPTPPETTK